MFLAKNRYYEFIGISCERNGDTFFGSDSYLGKYSEDGYSSSSNPMILDYDLEEIEDVKEMTVKQIEDELGHRVKVVKG